MGSMVKTAFHIIASLALLHLLGLTGLIAYLYANGKLTADRADAIAEILLGEGPATDDADAEAEGPKAVAQRSEESIAREQVREEMLRRATERKLAELFQKQVAVNLLMQKVTKDMEELDQKKVDFAAQTQAEVRKEQDEGFKKTLELLETAPSEIAKDLLLQLNDEDAAAGMLLKMDTRKGTKTLQAAMEDPVLRPKALKVFKRVRELAPEGSDWAAAAQPGGES